MNDEERRLWIENDEGLYRWRLSTGLGIYPFINKYRKELTQIIRGEK